MATQPDDAAFLQKYGNYKPAPADVPVTTIKPIIGGETPEEAAARRAQEAREARGGELAEEAAARAARGEAREVESKEFTQIGSLRTEFLGIPEVKEFRQVRNATRQIIDLTSKGTPMANIGAVFSYMKILDPGSTVREGEAASAQNAAGVPDRIRNYYNQLVSGQGLSEAQRKDMADVARSIYNQRVLGYNDLANTYRGLISELGADPDKQGITLAEPFEIEDKIDRISQLQQAFDNKASLADLNKLAAELGLTPNPEDLQKAVEFRDAGGVGAKILSPETGGAPEETGFFEGIVETVTGSERSTPEIEALPEWTTMPELNELSLAGAATGIGTMFTSPEESVQIIKSNYPDVQVRQDSKGNYILRSQNGQEYAIKPGFRWSDVPRAIGGILAFTPAGRATTVAGAAGGSALTQAAIEATQAATGGQFDTGEIVVAGGAGAGGKLIEQVLPAAVSAVRGMRRGPEVPVTAPSAPAAPSGVAQAAVPETPITPVQPAPAAPAAAPMAAPEAAAEIGAVIRDASGTGVKAKGAQIKLAEMAQINPEAKAAAERLGIELPADVFSDNPQVRAAVGLTRSLAGSEAEAAWRTSVSNAVDQADNVLREFDAQFVEGAVSPGAVSQRVKESLINTRSDLNAEASAIYKRVDDSVPKQTPVQMDNLFRELTAIAGEVGEGGMTAQEKRLMSMIQSGEATGGDITYGRLIREKNLIGKALRREESPYGSLDEATLKRLYAALANDQLDNVARIGGEELRSQLRGANLIYAKERALGERIVNAFGRDLEGGIANKMRAAISGAAKGDPGEFARLMKAVPKDLRKEVVATALTAAARSARGAEKGGFGFSEFADLYPKLRANPTVYKQIVETLGPKASDALRDLYQVSKRITEARANVLTTGKANQALVESLNAEGVIARIMDTSIAKRAVGAAAGAAGPIAGAIMPDIMEVMAKGNPDTIRAAGKMFSSPEFQMLLTEVATQPNVTDRAINRVASSGRFRDFIKATGLNIKDAKMWLRSAVTPAAVTQSQQETMEEAGGAPVVRIQQ